MHWLNGNAQDDPDPAGVAEWIESLKAVITTTAPPAHQLEGMVG